MMKKLLTISALAFASLMNAQTGRIVAGQTMIGASVSQQKAAADLCDTITTITSTSLTVYGAGSDTATPGCSPLAGYIFGSNCYDDKEKANFFGASTFSSIGNPSVTAVIATFFKAGNKGTNGTTASGNMMLYSGTSATAAPGALLAGGTSTATLAQIIATQTNVANPLFQYTYVFSSSVAIPATGFFASVQTPTTAGDTIVAITQASATANFAWEKWSDDSWHDVSVAWGGLKGNIAFLPVVCGNTVATSISSNQSWGRKFTMMPNPSAGNVEIHVSSPSQENLNITVTNALGQQVKSLSFDNITYGILPVNLTEQSAGVYFVTITNGKEKMVQRLILTK